ncbi:putative cell cycle arrest in response to pheromone-related protein [Lyophyllum shimeji]|uniref:Cell cycle arrest in response to pheromone-related protein n=1 Tax=Lyophyllum shimeji TaxID=47721 RepID=A0A9P3US70_LYOSH|nr:putative cell cycle arrest in response to pheromone-related protein [Lyophyllum shimeji]
MPAPVQPVFPALYLYPLNDSFVPKHISLAHGQRVKIGRQTNAKTAPGERNGYFDSKVLSRQHAEVWEDGNKIFIKDVKSSNGTFINGERLSPEGLESDPYELKSDDIVEFGIDIVGEDNKTIIHHKVAARVVCVFTEQDAQVAARAEQLQQQHLQQYQPSAAQTSSMLAQPGPSNAAANGANTFNFAPGQQRRPQMTQQGLAGMGGMGGSMRPPGKSGLTFDHILSRLQGELQKSRETGAELHTLTGAMNEIHDTLGGNLPATLPSYPASLPPVRAPPQAQPTTQPSSQEPSAPVSSSGSPQQAAPAPSAALTTSALVDIQTQLQETQSSLSSHVDKIRALEGVLAEQEAIKREIRALREMMETKRREIELEDDRRAREREQEQEPRGGFDEEDEEEGSTHDDDDARSISTVVPHELERVEEEDEEQLAAEAQEQEIHEEEHEKEPHEEEPEDEEGRRRRNDELGRPRTPEPTNLGMRDGDPFSSHHRSKLLTAPRRSSPSSPLSKVAASAASASTSEEMFEHVLKQVENLMALTSSLEAQHTAAQSTISALEGKVQALEATVKATQEAAAAAQVQRQTQTSPPASPTEAQAPAPPPPPAPAVEERESLTAMVLEWKKSMEGQWSSVREDWDKERERLYQAREQWESHVRSMDEKFNAQTAALQAQQEQIQRQQQQQQQQLQHVGLANGDASKHIGLVTPPSPRSLSSDSTRPRRRKSGARRGRSRQSSRSRSTGSRDGEVDTDTDATLASEEASPGKGGAVLSATGSFNSKRPDEEEEEGEEDGEDTVLGVRSRTNENSGAETLATPDSSVYKLPTRSKPGDVVEGQNPTTTKSVGAQRDTYQIQTFVGAAIIAVAAVAVIWRVKPETV